MVIYIAFVLLKVTAGHASCSVTSDFPCHLRRQYSIQCHLSSRARAIGPSAVTLGWTHSLHIAAVKAFKKLNNCEQKNCLSNN